MDASATSAKNEHNSHYGRLITPSNLPPVWWCCYDRRISSRFRPSISTMLPRWEGGSKSSEIEAHASRRPGMRERWDGLDLPLCPTLVFDMGTFNQRNERLVEFTSVCPGVVLSSRFTVRTIQTFTYRFHGNAWVSFEHRYSCKTVRR